MITESKVWLIAQRGATLKLPYLIAIFHVQLKF